MGDNESNLSQAFNNIYVSETGTFTDVLESRSSSSDDQKSKENIKDVANDFESLTVKPISAGSLARDALDIKDLKLNPKATNEEVNNSQEDEEYSRPFQRCSSSDLVSKTAIKTIRSHSGYEVVYPEQVQENKESDNNDTKVTKKNFEIPRNLSSQTDPRSSSPISSDGLLNLGERITRGSLDNYEHESEIRENISTVNQNDSITLELNLPEVPQHDPTASFDESSSIDGGSRSDVSSSMSRSYMYSSASVDVPNPLQSDGDHLIPKYKADGKGFCWPINKLPLSGDLQFEENVQWKVLKKIGHGASGQCFQGHLIHKKDFNFCVKKCQYKKEEVKAMFLAAKEIHEKRGASKIVSFYGALYYKPDVCIFMEYMEGGTVNEAVYAARSQNKEGLDKTDCVHYLEDILLALEFLHSKGLVHNDVKASNALLSAFKIEAKLCDFDKAHAIDKHNSPSRDIWLAGCFLLEMLGTKYSSALMSGFLKKSNVLKQLPKDVKQDTYEVLSWCFSNDRSMCTASNILKSAFFKYSAN